VFHQCDVTEYRTLDSLAALCLPHASCPPGEVCCYNFLTDKFTVGSLSVVAEDEFKFNLSLPIGRMNTLLGGWLKLAFNDNDNDNSINDAQQQTGK